MTARVLYCTALALPAALTFHNALAQSEAEFVFLKAAPSIVIVTTDHGKQGSAVAYLDLGETGTGLVTNCHTLVGATSLRVSQRGRTANAVFLFGDPAVDICIVATPLRLPVVPPRTFFELRVGETVYAIGAPRGLELSITNGIISQLRGSPFEPPMLVQTTAPISPGSSGGGLFDSRGRLIGLTTFMLRESQALNFAISINMANHLPNDRAAKRLSDLSAEKK